MSAHSMRRAGRAMAVALMSGLLLATAAAAQAGPFTDLRGHLGLGYAGLMIADAPGGSMAGAAGLDLPLSRELRAGIEIGFDLLGNRLAERGSLVAELDYSLVEALALVHWKPSWSGPVGRISAGPGVFGARISQSSAGPAAFEDLTLRSAAPGLALSATLMPKRASHVLAGIELGTRYVVVPGDDWFLVNTRLVVHF